MDMVVSNAEHICRKGDWSSSEGREDSGTLRAERMNVLYAPVAKGTPFMSIVFISRMWKGLSEVAHCN